MPQFYGFDRGYAGKVIIEAPRRRALTHFLQIASVEGAPKDAPLCFMTGPWRTAMTSKRTWFSHGYLLVDLLLITEVSEGIIPEAIRHCRPLHASQLLQLFESLALVDSGCFSC